MSFETLARVKTSSRIDGVRFLQKQLVNEKVQKHINIFDEMDPKLYPKGPPWPLLDLT